MHTSTNPTVLLISQCPTLGEQLQDDVPWQLRSLNAQALTQGTNALIRQKAVALIVADFRQSDETQRNLLHSLLQQLPENLPVVALVDDTMARNELIQLINSCSVQKLQHTPVDIAQLRQQLHMLWPGSTRILARRQQWLQKRLADQVSQFRSVFFDYTSMEDDVLSQRLIAALYDFFDQNDDNHQCRTYRPNHTLTREGKPNQSLWFITKGQVSLRKGTKEVAVMGAGSIVGGSSFVTGEHAFTTGVTLENTDVIKLDRTSFSRVLDSNTELLPMFTNLLLRLFNRRLQKSIRTELALQATLDSLSRAQLQLVEQEKMAVLGQLVAGVAHELNNPVAAIVRGSETISEQLPALLLEEHKPQVRSLGWAILERSFNAAPASTLELRQRARAIAKRYPNNQNARLVVAMNLDQDEIWQQLNQKPYTIDNEQLSQLERYQRVGTFLRNIGVCGERIAGLVRRLKHYAGQDAEQPVEADINEGIADTLVILENRLKQVKLDCHYGELPSLRCFPITLQQVWTNIVANALDAMENSGALRIETRFNDATKQVEVLISDDGPGIPLTLQSKIFELNFTTKREGHFGLGIGLNVCQQIVKQHGGTIGLNSRPNEGCQFIIKLPVSGVA